MVRAIRQYEKEKGLKPQLIVGLTGHATGGDFDEICREAGIKEVFKNL